MIYTTIGIYLGVLFAFVWKARKFIQHGEFSFSIWFKENRNRSIWALVFGTIVGAVVTYYPDSVDALEFIGFNMDQESGTMSEILIGLVLTYATYSKTEETNESNQ